MIKRHAGAVFGSYISQPSRPVLLLLLILWKWFGDKYLWKQPKRVWTFKPKQIRSCCAVVVNWFRKTILKGWASRPFWNSKHKILTLEGFFPKLNKVTSNIFAKRPFSSEESNNKTKEKKKGCVTHKATESSKHVDTSCSCYNCLLLCRDVMIGSWCTGFFLSHKCLRCEIHVLCSVAMSWVCPGAQFSNVYVVKYMFFALWRCHESVLVHSFQMSTLWSNDVQI